MVCPVCISAGLYELPRDIAVRATFRGHSEDVRGFVCAQGHVFLCRPCDVGADVKVQVPELTLESCAAVAA